MGYEADDAPGPTLDRPPPARAAIADPQPDRPVAGHLLPAERFSPLAELAEDPANGLREIEPGVYVCRKDCAVSPPVGRDAPTPETLQGARLTAY